MSHQLNSPAIELASVSKVYHTYSSPRHRLLEILSGGKKRFSRETKALDDISFKLEKGSRLGIVGENGSGKSTLLKVLSGVLTPSAGNVNVNGRISALLELGAGFNPELTGRENISQFCMLHGLHRDEIEAALPEIIRFSELKDAIEHPVKTYSSGMAVRLGFACAVHVQPDILIVDEALSVGDAYFQNKCLHKIRSMLDNGVTFLYVTHAADAIRSLCNQGLWLENGRVKLYGEASVVGGAYQSEIFSRLVRAGYEGNSAEDTVKTDDAKEGCTRTAQIDRARQAAFSERVAPLRTGSGEVRIDDISILDAHGEETHGVEVDQKMHVRVFFHVRSEPPKNCVLNLGITDSSGRQIIHLNPMFLGLFASDAAPQIPHVMEFEFSNPLCPGEYGVIAGIATLSEHPQNNGQTMIDSVIDYCAGGARFAVNFPDRKIKRDLWGVVHVDYHASMHALD